jgi:hypothetical protein
MKPIKYRGYELVPDFKFKCADGLERYDWAIFKEGHERGFGLHYKTLEEAKEYVNDLIEE